MNDLDKKIFEELEGHLNNWANWANAADGRLDTDGFSCVRSTMDAVIEKKRLGLALTRWDDLSSPNKPRLSEAAENWRSEDAISALELDKWLRFAGCHHLGYAGVTVGQNGEFLVHWKPKRMKPGGMPTTFSGKKISVITDAIVD